jgi:hypothetical protein
MPTSTKGAVNVMANNTSLNTPVFQTADVPAGVTGTPASDIPKTTTKKEENQMADVDTYTLAGQHSDIRREAAEHTNEIIKEGLKAEYNLGAAVKDARFDINSRISEASDVSDNRFFHTGRDLSDIRAQIVSAQQQVVAGFLGASKDAEINALRTQVELAKQTTYLSDKIDAGNQRTTDLISALRDSDQNRMLVERNTELVAALNDGRWWNEWGRFRGGWDSNQQFVSNRLNALDSQLQDTRQGMVNFGTMAGVGQSSTSNNVK